MLQKRAIETYKSMYTFYCKLIRVHQCESPSKRTTPTLTHTHTINHRTQQPLEGDTGHRRIIGECERGEGRTRPVIISVHPAPALEVVGRNSSPPCLPRVMKLRSGGMAPLLAAEAAASLANGLGKKSASLPGLMNMLPASSGPSRVWISSASFLASSSVCEMSKKEAEEIQTLDGPDEAGNMFMRPGKLADYS